MCSTAKDLSQCCAVYSATGLVFMSWVGFMLMTQPFYVGGIDNVESAKGSAFGAAGLFFFIFLISIVHLIMDSMNGGSALDVVRSASFDGWTGQRQNSAPDYGQVPPFEDFENDGSNQGQTERTGFLS